MIKLRNKAITAHDHIDMQQQNVPFSSLYPIVRTPNEQGGILNTIYILREIEGPEHFAEVFDTLLFAQPEDQIIIVLSTPGGRMDSTVGFVDTLRQCAAPTLCKAFGAVSSAGTIIAAACDDLEVAPYTDFMYHNYSSGTFGKGHELLAAVKAEAESCNAMFRDVYSHVLSSEEIEYIIKGGDLYLHEPEVTARWEKYIEERETKVAEENTTNQLTAMTSYLKDLGYTVTAIEEAKSKAPRKSKTT